MKTTSKQADATLKQLVNVMTRNTELATATPPTSASIGPTATYTPKSVASIRKPIPTSASHAMGIRLKSDDTTRIRQVIQAGLALQETLTGTDVIRLALAAYEPKRLTTGDIAQLRAKDGRSQASKAIVTR